MLVISLRQKVSPRNRINVKVFIILHFNTMRVHIKREIYSVLHRVHLFHINFLLFLHSFKESQKFGFEVIFSLIRHIIIGAQV